MQCQLRTSDGISFIFILLTFLISSGASLYSLIATCIDVLLSYVTCDDDLIQVIIYWTQRYSMVIISSKQNFNSSKWEEHMSLALN